MPQPIPDTLETPTTLPAFARQFATEAACVDFLWALRYPDGFVCPNCKSTKAWVAGPDREMICSGGHRTTITAGTIMHRSKQPLTTWFYAAYLVSTLTPGISALQFQKQLGLKRYETAFQMLHKLRSGLVAPDREQLHTEVEVDEAFVGGLEEGRPGRGAETKALVVCAVEVVRWTAPDPHAPDDPNAGVERVRAGRVRLSVIPDASAETLVPWVVKTIKVGTTVNTDGWPSYRPIERLGYDHRITLQSHKGKPTGAFLPLVHLIISNLKRWLLGTHKGAVLPKHLPAYLNEFAFRFNRRFWRGPAFARALGLAVHAEKWPEYDTLYAVGSDEEEAWVHPNPRRDLHEDVIHALVADLYDAASPEVQAWMTNNAERVAATMRHAIERRR